MVVRRVALLVALSVLAGSLPPLGAGAQPDGQVVERVAGSSRLATAVALSQASFPRGAAAVVVARHDDYPDALAGGPLAARLGAPVLLTESGQLSAAVADEVRRLDAGRAVLLGGPAALSERVAADLRALGVGRVDRIAGASRFDTARLVAAQLGGATQAYLSEGGNADPARGWPDAVAVSALAARQVRPILLASADRLPAETAQAIAELGIAHVTVVGGAAAVSEDVAAAARGLGATVERVAGASRLQTSELVADRTVAAGAEPGRLWLATGANWPDALAAGPAAAAAGGTLLLVAGGSLDQSPAVREWVRVWRADVARIVLVGGPGAISEDIASELAAEVAGDAPAELGAPLLGLRDDHWPFERFELSDRRTAAVNLASGNLVVREADLRIAGTGLDATVERFYNSRASAALDAGQRWVMWPQTGTRLTPRDDGSVVVRRDWEAVFVADGAGGYVSPPGLDADLTRAADGTWTLAFRRGLQERYRFDAAGRLQARADRNDNTVVFGYESGQMTSMTDTQGRVVTFDRAGDGPVQAMTDAAGRTWRYDYDGAALAGYTDPAGAATRYLNHPRLGLGGIVDAEGHLTEFVVDHRQRVAAVRRVLDPATGAAHVTTFRYEPGRTVVTDPNGHVTAYHLDANGQAVAVVDALGQTRSYAYSPNGDVADDTNAAGATTTRTYDDSGNLTGVRLPTGASTSLFYDDEANPFQPTRLADAQDNMWSYGYDAAGNLTSMTDPSGAAYRLARNTDGTLASVTDPAGTVTTYRYDDAGNPVAVDHPDPLGDEALAYDRLGRVAARTDGKGQTTRYRYDPLDRLVAVTAADGVAVAFAYDANGNRVGMTDATGATGYAYDPLGRLVSQRLPDGQTVTAAYDGADNLIWLADAGGQVGYEHNRIDLLERLVEPDGATTTFAYDPAGNRTETRFPNGVTQRIDYDLARRVTLVQATDAAGQVLTRFAYGYARQGADSALRQTVTDRLGRVTSYA
ncbi:MAG TPA: cell wall-binding repeat-containing protein, partial [Egibacteraceae bacterium]|nr:cell wall-binding repeat-containing protein [Egibacteraceae bacterium]